jgi:hypothetical protein
VLCGLTKKGSWLGYFYSYPEFRYPKRLSISAAAGSPHPAVVSNLSSTPSFLVLNTGFAVGLCYNIGARHRPTRSRRREDYSASLGLDGLLVCMGGGLVMSGVR